MRSFILLLLSAGACLGATLTANPFGCDYNQGSCATAAYGSIYVSSTGNAAHPSTSATAAFSDSVIIEGGEGIGYLEVTPLLQSFGFENPFVMGRLDIGTADWFFFDRRYTNRDPKTIAFTFGQPISFAADLHSWADVPYPYTGPQYDVYANIRITSMRVFDANRNLLDSYTYSTESGAAYTFLGGVQILSDTSFDLGPLTVPEPATWMPAAIGLGMFLKRRCGR